MKPFQQLTIQEYEEIVNNYNSLKKQIKSLSNIKANAIRKQPFTEQQELEYQNKLNLLQEQYKQFEIPYICNNCGKVFNLSLVNFKKLIKEPNYKFCCSKSCATTYKNINYYNNLTEHQKQERNNKIRNSIINKYKEDKDYKNKLKQHGKEMLTNYWQNKTETERSNINRKSAIVSAQTKLSKYGSTTYNNSEQAKQTNLKLYGVQNQFQRKEIRQLQNEVIKEKYGVNNFFENREQFEKVSLEKYGTTHPMQNEQVKEKLHNTKQIRYGNGKYNNPEKCTTTFLERYGVKRPFQLKKYIAKSNQTKYKHLKTTGVISYGQISKTNVKFAHFINSNDLEFPIETYSYDVKLGNTLFELDPTFTHNLYGNKLFGKFENVDPNYHLNKTLKAQEAGYKCIHIFDWDDWYKIKYLIQEKETLYARQLILKEVDIKETNEFLNLYHLQNTCKGQEVRLGLYKDNELIEIMTFGKPRYNKNYEWELLRLCTHKDYKVVGGAEKLFKCFIQNYKPTNVISYCDFSKFTGEVYNKLGFIQKGKPTPIKHWSKGSKQITDNLLRQRGYDQLFNTNYGKGTNNEELMIQNGWLPVCDCGQLVFTFSNKML